MAELADQERLVAEAVRRNRQASQEFCDLLSDVVTEATTVRIRLEVLRERARSTPALATLLRFEYERNDRVRQEATAALGALGAMLKELAK